MAQPEANNFRLISHDTMSGFGNVGEGMSLQLAKGGRRIMWMAHECAPKNFTGVDVTDPTQAASRRADRPAASQRAVELAGDLRPDHGGGVPDRHARRDAGGDRAVRYLHARAAAQHQLHRSLGATIARRAPALVHRRQDDPLLQRRGRLHAAQPEGRSVLHGVRRERSGEAARARSLVVSGDRGARRGAAGAAASEVRHGLARAQYKCISGAAGPRLCRLHRRRRLRAGHFRHRQAEAGWALEPASAVPRLHPHGDAAVRSRPLRGQR